MAKILFYLLNFLYFLLLDYVFFGLTAKFKGKQCNYDCSQCTNWACTHGSNNEQHSCYPVRDWVNWCKGGS